MFYLILGAIDIVLALCLLYLIYKFNKQNNHVDKFIGALIKDNQYLEKKNKKLKEQNADLEHSIALLYREVNRLESSDLNMKSPNDDPLFHLKGDQIPLD